jgi:hypothetical protein
MSSQKSGVERQDVELRIQGNEGVSLHSRLLTTRHLHAGYCSPPSALCRVRFRLSNWNGFFSVGRSR